MDDMRADSWNFLGHSKEKVKQGKSHVNEPNPLNARLMDDMHADSWNYLGRSKEKEKQGKSHANEPNPLQITAAATHAKCINAREFTLGTYEKMFNYRNATIHGRQKSKTNLLHNWMASSTRASARVSPASAKRITGSQTWYNAASCPRTC